MTVRSLFAVLGVVFLLSACAGPETAGEAGESPSSSSGGSGSSAGSGGSSGGSQTASLPGSVDPQSILINEIGDRVFFAFDSSSLTARAQQVLRAQAAFLDRFSGVSVIIAGHCDERGTKEYNLALGERRASSARNFLISLGVDGRRIDTISYGKERPEAVGNGEEYWKQNRRSVMAIR